MKSTYKIIDPKSITALYTHAGKFHADDVFATALLRIAGCNAPVHRVNSVPKNLTEHDLVFDIGFGRYDHHMSDNLKQYRKNGTPYAAFGLLMKDYYTYLGLDETEYIYIDNSFVKDIDGTDNGYFRKVYKTYCNYQYDGFGGNTLTAVISSMNPLWDEDNLSISQAFDDAVIFAIRILSRQIETTKARTRAVDVANRATIINNVAVLDRFAPVNSYFSGNPNIDWICFPSNRGGYNINSVIYYGNNKALMPLEFRGKDSEYLPEGMYFCHPAGFIAGFNDLDSALKFADTYLKRV